MILLIAYGNALRRDDGAGLLLAEELERQWQSRGVVMRRITAHQLTPELAVDIVGAEATAVFFCDARLAEMEDEAGVTIESLTVGSATSPALGHQLGPTTVLAYANLLRTGQSLPPAWLVTAPGVDFDHGEGLSTYAQAAVARALADDSPLQTLLRAFIDHASSPSPVSNLHRP